MDGDSIHTCALLHHAIEIDRPWSLLAANQVSSRRSGALLDMAIWIVGLTFFFFFFLVLPPSEHTAISICRKEQRKKYVQNDVYVVLCNVGGQKYAYARWAEKLKERARGPELL